MDQPIVDETQFRPEPLQKRILVVASFPRSGTSLTMQMLAAGGMDCIGEYPGYEDERTLPIRVSREFMQSCRGKAVKILDAHIRVLPEGFEYDFVFVKRDHKQQARSIVKFLTTLGIYGTITVGQYQRSIKRDQPRALMMLKKYKGSRLMELSFEQIITDPMRSALLLDNFVGGLNVREMVAQIRPRSTGCLPHMLEAELLNDPRAKK